MRSYSSAIRSSPVYLAALPSMLFNTTGLIVALDLLLPRRSDEGGPGGSHALRSSPHRWCGSGKHNERTLGNLRYPVGHTSRFPTGCQAANVRHGLRGEALHGFGRRACA